MQRLTKSAIARIRGVKEAGFAQAKATGSKFTPPQKWPKPVPVKPLALEMGHEHLIGGLYKDAELDALRNSQGMLTDPPLCYKCSDARYVKDRPIGPSRGPWDWALVVCDCWDSEAAKEA